MASATKRIAKKENGTPITSSSSSVLLMRFLLVLFVIPIILISASTTEEEEEEEVPTPTPWPKQFHATIFTNKSGALQMVDLWYDWPNGRNLNIEQDQLAQLPLYNVEWTNGTSFFFSSSSSSSAEYYCDIVHFEVGILRPNWMVNGANYLGQRHVDGFLCNVWEKVDYFITYYEDVISKRPVHWLLFTGKEAHFMTFEVGAVLEDAKWQAPAYCFEKKDIAKTDHLKADNKVVDISFLQQEFL